MQGRQPPHHAAGPPGDHAFGAARSGSPTARSPPAPSQHRGIQRRSLTVREHRPQPLEGRGWNRGPNIATSRSRYVRMKSRRSARQSSRSRPGSCPESRRATTVSLGRTGVLHFERGERRQVDVRDASGQRLARLAQQVDRRRSQEEEPASPSPAPASVDGAAQRLEQLRHSVDLVENDQLTSTLSRNSAGSASRLRSSRSSSSSIERIARPCGLHRASSCRPVAVRAAPRRPDVGGRVRVGCDDPRNRLEIYPRFGQFTRFFTDAAWPWPPW